MMLSDVDIGLNIPATFTIEKLDKLLMEIGDVDIGPIPANLPPITQVTMLDCCIYMMSIVILMIVIMKMKELILGVMVQDVEFGLNRSATLPFTTMEKLLMVMVEVDIGLRSSPLPPIIQVILLDYWVFIPTAITEVEIGLRQANFPHITMLEHTFTTQGPPKKLFQGV